jgi:hypothetical protein
MVQGRWCLEHHSRKHKSLILHCVTKKTVSTSLTVFYCINIRVYTSFTFLAATIISSPTPINERRLYMALCIQTKI